MFKLWCERGISLTNTEIKQRFLRNSLVLMAKIKLPKNVIAWLCFE